MKKRLSILLTLALVLTMLTPAFAFAAPTDVVGTKYEDAVESLSSLNVLKGYPDGTFKPDNTITRAEFSAVAVRLLGLEDAANVSKGVTKFNDMAGYDWASGYINVAAQQGIILGYPDGSFKPGNPVSQAEALTMLVRVLGYEPVVSKEGWPTNYLVKASEIGLTTGVAGVEASAPASRGAVALFSENALYVDKMVQTGITGTTSSYSVDEGNTLLTKNLGATEYKGLVVDSYEMLNSVAMKEGEIALDVDYKNGEAYAGLPVILEGNDIEGLFGKYVTVWATNDGTIIKSSLSETVLTGTVASNTTTTVTFVGKDSIPFQTTSGVVNGIFVMDYQANTAGFAVDELKGLTVEYTVNRNGEVDYLRAVNYDGLNADYYVVDDVDKETVISKFSSTDNDLTLTNMNYNIDLSELNEFDVVYAFNVGDRYQLDVFSDSVTGKFALKYSDGDFKIGGSRYDVNADVKYSSNNGASVNDIALYTNFLNESVTAVLDAYGNVLYVFANIDITAPANFMAVTDFDSTTQLGETRFYVKALNQENKEQWYEVTSKTKFYDEVGNARSVGTDSTVGGATYYLDVVADLDDLFGATNLTNGTEYYLVDVQLNEDGTVAKVGLPLGNTTFDNDVVSTDLIKDRNLVYTGSNWTPVSQGAVFFDNVNNKFVSWTEVASISSLTSLEAYITNDGGVATVFNITSGTITNNALEGVVVASYETPDGQYILALNQEGVVTEYTADKGVYLDIKDLDVYNNDFVTLTMTSGKVSNVSTHIDAEGVALTVKSVGTLSIKTTDGTVDTLNYLDEGVLVYDITGDEPEFANLSDIVKDNGVLFYDADGDTLFDVVLIVE